DELAQERPVRRAALQLLRVVGQGTSTDAWRDARICPCEMRQSVVGRSEGLVQLGEPAPLALLRDALASQPSVRRLRLLWLRAPQRLCCLSSVLPWRFVPDHGVEDDEQFAGDRNESDHLWLSGREKALIEGPQDGVVLLGG